MNDFLRMLRSRAFWKGFLDGWTLAGFYLAPVVLILQILILCSIIAGCR